MKGKQSLELSKGSFFLSLSSLQNASWVFCFFFPFFSLISALCNHHLISLVLWLLFATLILVPQRTSITFYYSSEYMRWDYYFPCWIISSFFLWVSYQSMKINELSLPKVRCHFSFSTELQHRKEMVNLMFLDLSLSFSLNCLPVEYFTHHSILKIITYNHQKIVFSQICLFIFSCLLHVHYPIWVIVFEVAPPGALWLEGLLTLSACHSQEP